MRTVEIPKKSVALRDLPPGEAELAAAINHSNVGDGDHESLSDAELRAIRPFVDQYLETDEERAAARGLYCRLEVPLPPSLARAPSARIDELFGPPRTDDAGQVIRTTRLVNTLGPRSSDAATIAQMIRAGTDVVRLNFSHVRSLDQALPLVEAIKAAEVLAGRPVRMLADLPGPKIRLGVFEGGADLAVGAMVHFQASPTDLEAGRLQVDPPDILADIREGQRVLLNDGKVELKVVRCDPSGVTAEVISGGPISSRKGMNLPETRLTRRLPTPEDLSAIEILKALDAQGHRIDLIAVSYVEDADDIAAVRAAFPWPIHAVAKVERPQAMDNLAGIMDAADVVMDARGDRKVEMGAEQIAWGQERIHQMGGLMAVPTGTATQVLSSMVDGAPALNAEITDIANAVRLRSEFVMTSEETAMAMDPPRVVREMNSLVVTSERLYDQLWTAVDI